MRGGDEPVQSIQFGGLFQQQQQPVQMQQMAQQVLSAISQLQQNQAQLMAFVRGDRQCPSALGDAPGFMESQLRLPELGGAPGFMPPSDPHLRLPAIGDAEQPRTPQSRQAKPPTPLSQLKNLLRPPLQGAPSSSADERAKALADEKIKIANAAATDAKAVAEENIRIANAAAIVAKPVAEEPVRMAETEATAAAAEANNANGVPPAGKKGRANLSPEAAMQTLELAFRRRDVVKAEKKLEDDNNGETVAKTDAKNGKKKTHGSRKPPMKTAVLKRPASHKDQNVVRMSMEWSRLRVIVRSPVGAKLFAFGSHGGQDGAIKAARTEEAKLKKQFKCK